MPARAPDRRATAEGRRPEPRPPTAVPPAAEQVLASSRSCGNLAVARWPARDATAAAPAADPCAEGIDEAFAQAEEWLTAVGKLRRWEAFELGQMPDMEPSAEHQRVGRVVEGILHTRQRMYVQVVRRRVRHAAAHLREDFRQRL